MKTKTVAAATIAALLLTVVATAAFASAGHPATRSASGDEQNGKQNGTQENHQNGTHQDGGKGGSHFAVCNNLTSGETLTVSGLLGRYANASDSEMSGNASGTFTFKVDGIYAQGCTLSITEGSFKLNTTTYSVTGGSMVLGEGGRSGVGSGTTSSGTFLIRIDGLRGNSTSANVGAVGLDFKTGTSQFLVQLHSPAAESDAAEGE